MPRPRQVRRTAVSAFSARPGRSTSRSRPGAADHLVVVQGQEHRVAEPRGVPLLGADLQRRVHREVGEHLLAERLVAGGPQVGALARLDHLDPGRPTRRSGLVAHSACLLDLAVDLDEPEVLGEHQGALVVDTGRDAWAGPARCSARPGLAVALTRRRAGGARAGRVARRTLRRRCRTDRRCRSRPPRRPPRPAAGDGPASRAHASPRQ